jgi:hypothetical protein
MMALVRVSNLVYVYQFSVEEYTFEIILRVLHGNCWHQVAWISDDQTLTHLGSGFLRFRRFYTSLRIGKVDDKLFLFDGQKPTKVEVNVFDDKVIIMNLAKLTPEDIAFLPPDLDGSIVVSVI